MARLAPRSMLMQSLLDFENTVAGDGKPPFDAFTAAISRTCHRYSPNKHCTLIENVS